MIFYSLSRSLLLDAWICILFILIQLRQRLTPAGVRMPRCCWMWYRLRGWPPCHIWLRADYCPFVLLFEGYPTNCRNHIRTTQQPEKTRQAPWFPIIVYNRPSILLFSIFVNRNRHGLYSSLRGLTGMLLISVANYACPCYGGTMVQILVKIPAQ